MKAQKPKLVKTGKWPGTASEYTKRPGTSCKEPPRKESEELHPKAKGLVPSQELYPKAKGLVPSRGLV